MEVLPALLFGIAASAAGLFILEAMVGRTSSVLAGLTLISYLLVYTPLKRKTELCTIVGAVPGALPPLIGWSSAGASLTLEAWILFSILFLWQMPHFLAIGWMYRHEYANAGCRMLSVNDTDGYRVGRQIILYSLALLPVSLLPTLVGLTGLIYFFGALALGIGLIIFAVASLKQLDAKARFLFRASVIYLSCLLILMIADKT
jgi:protoheme IX farnesyltransferase